jgi:hypothetical protein
MSQKPLYFSRSVTKTILLHIPELAKQTARMFEIRKERMKIRIYLTICDNDDATHIPLATYETMENALADMDDLFKSFMPKEGEMIHG